MDAHQEFRDVILRALSEPRGFLRSHTLPRSSPVFLFATGLSGGCEHVAPAGLAVELLLAATDLLDPIQDAEGDGTIPQAQALNEATALLLLNPICLGGLCKKNEPARAARASTVLELAAFRSCQGQSLDLAFESRQAVTEHEYLQMIEWKAGAPLSAICSAGALLSTDDGERIEAAASYGRWLGMARQMKNDAAAIISGENKSDIRRKKKTLPAIYALEKAQGTDGRFLHGVYAAATAPSRAEEARIRKVILSSGGVHYALVTAGIYCQRAAEQVEKTGLPADIADRLKAMASL